MPEIIPNWHPLLVHFTIGLLLTGTVFYLLALLLPSERLSLEAVLAARWTLAAGVAITVATVLAGWYAYGSVAHDDAGHAAMTDHRNWALATGAVFLLMVLWDLLRARAGHKAGVPVGVMLLVASVGLAVTGYKGGEVVYRHGIGVMSLPAAGDHGHRADEHGSAPEEGDYPHAEEAQGRVKAKPAPDAADATAGVAEDGGPVAGGNGGEADTSHDHGDHEH